VQYSTVRYSTGRYSTVLYIIHCTVECTTKTFFPTNEPGSGLVGLASFFVEKNVFMVHSTVQSLIELVLSGNMFTK